MKNRYLEIGKVINKRGIAGELKVECYCDSPSVAKSVKTVYTDKNATGAHKTVWVKEYKGCIYIKLEDISSPEEADAMRGKILFADRDELNVCKNKTFIADLLGLEIIDADTGKAYGKLYDIVNYGAGNIYVIRDGKNEYMMPETNDMIVETNIESHIKIRPISGIFDDAEEIR